MKKNFKAFNEFTLHFEKENHGPEHGRLAQYVHDNPELTYEEYKSKAKSMSINYASEERMHEWGFCQPPVPTIIVEEVTGVE